MLAEAIIGWPDAGRNLGRAAAAWRRASITGRGARLFIEQLDELVGHGAGQFARIGDGDGAAVVAGHVVADADGDQLDRASGFRFP